jgi:hypothetical protein
MSIESAVNLRLGSEAEGLEQGALTSADAACAVAGRPVADGSWLPKQAFEEPDAVARHLACRRPPGTSAVGRVLSGGDSVGGKRVRPHRLSDTGLDNQSRHGWRSTDAGGLPASARGSERLSAIGGDHRARWAETIGRADGAE